MDFSTCTSAEPQVTLRTSDRSAFSLLTCMHACSKVVNWLYWPGDSRRTVTQPPRGRHLYRRTPFGKSISRLEGRFDWCCARRSTQLRRISVMAQHFCPNGAIPCPLQYRGSALNPLGPPYCTARSSTPHMCSNTSTSMAALNLLRVPKRIDVDLGGL
jgi:hypothetical protein